MSQKYYEKLPKSMQNEAVYEYCEILSKKKFTLFLKRFFDITVSFLAIFVLIIPFAFISFWIVFDLPGYFHFYYAINDYNKFLLKLSMLHIMCVHCIHRKDF